MMPLLLKLNFAHILKPAFLDYFIGHDYERRLMHSARTRLYFGTKLD